MSMSGFMRAVAHGLCMASVLISTVVVAVPVDGLIAEIDVPGNETVTVTDLADVFKGVVSAGSGHWINKVGEGTLVLAGKVAYVNVNVSNGVMRLARTDNTECVRYVNVAKDAKLVFDQDNAIRSAGRIYLSGTLDMNGHSATFFSLYMVKEINSSVALANIFRDELSGRIVNTSAQAASLTLTQEAQLVGHCEKAEESGRMEVEYAGNGTCYLLGPSSSFSGLSFVGSSGTFFSHSAVAAAKFVFTASRDGELPVSVGEVFLTLDGKPIDQTLYGTTTASSSADASHAAAQATDGDGATYWMSGSGKEATLTVNLTAATRVNGYRLMNGDPLASTPASWKLYLYRSDVGNWVLADERKASDGEVFHPYVKTMGRQLPFANVDMLGSPFTDQSDFELSSGASNALRLESNDPVVIGALSGSGGVSLSAGTILRPGDCSAWSGCYSVANASTADRMARVQLDASRGGIEQHVRLPATPVNLSVENATATPVSLLADDTVTTPLVGTLSDGEGPMGLVKAGSGTVRTEMQDASYTGVTEVRAGTLVVSGARDLKTVTSKYYRIRPLLVHGGDGYADSAGYNWSIAYFHLLDANGQALDVNDAEVTCAANIGANGSGVFQRGTASHRAIVGQLENDKSALVPVVLHRESGFVFSGYEWCRVATGSEPRAARTPVRMALDVSDDGKSWYTVDISQSPYASDDDQVRGPFGLNGSADGNSLVEEIPEAHHADVSDRTTRLKALKAQYFKFDPFDTRNTSMTEDNAYGWSISELNLYYKGERVDWPSDAGAVFSGSSGAGAAVNNVRTGSGLSERIFATEVPRYLYVNAHRVITFDAYGWTTTGGSRYSERMPKSWRLWISNDGRNWTLVDTRVDLKDSDFTIREYVDQGPWNLSDRFAHFGTACNALSDVSPLTVAAGATLEIDAAYEKVGPLSGRGAVRLDYGAVADVNAVAGLAASFAGCVAGSGTLVISGTGVQTLDQADLAGVRTLELNGGTLSGSASFGGGDLTLAFTGGSLDASLAGIGRLNVEGTPRILLPQTYESGPLEKVLVSASSIDDAVREKFGQAELVQTGAVKPKCAKIVMTENQIRLSVSRSGLQIMIK